MRYDIEEIRRAVRTLLPALRLRNYIEKWSEGSPAVRSLDLLSLWVGEVPVTAGADESPDSKTHHARSLIGVTEEELAEAMTAAVLSLLLPETSGGTRFTTSPNIDPDRSTE